MGNDKEKTYTFTLTELERNIVVEALRNRKDANKGDYYSTYWYLHLLDKIQHPRQNTTSQIKEQKMCKSLGTVLEEKIAKYNTGNNNYEDFPVGTKVRIITPYSDCCFFWEYQTGVVTKNTRRYLGIEVTFDIPMEFKDGYIKYNHGFSPEQLCKLDSGILGMCQQVLEDKQK
ncbi:MAG: hypothetical protein ACE5HR_00310 [bacterium]